MGRTSTFDLHDRILDGKLEQILRDWRAAGVGYDVIVDRLREEYDTRISRTTLNRWCRELGLA